MMTRGNERLLQPLVVHFNAIRGAATGSKTLATRSVYSNAKTGE